MAEINHCFQIESTKPSDQNHLPTNITELLSNYVAHLRPTDNKPSDAIAVTNGGHDLCMPNGDHLTIGQNGGWSMNDKDGKPVELKPQLTKDLPLHNPMSNGATYYPGMQFGKGVDDEIVYPNGTSIHFNQHGVTSLGLQFK